MRVGQLHKCLVFLLIAFLLLSFSAGSLAAIPDEPFPKATSPQLSAKPAAASTSRKPGKSLLEMTAAEKEWLAGHKTIRVAFDGYFPPYSFLDQDGNLKGLAVETMEYLAARLGIEFVIDSRLVWKDLYAAAKRREVDVVATMGARPERRQWFRFTRPYIFKSLTIFTRRETKDIAGPGDLSGRRVAVVRGYQYVEKLLTSYPNVKPVYVDTMLDGFNAVAVGQADAVIAFLAAGTYLMAQYQISTIKPAAIYDASTYDDSIGVRKDWPLLCRLLDRGLETMPDHEKQALARKWLPPTGAPGIDRRQVMRTFFLVVGIAILLLIGFLAWNLTLKRRVARQTAQLQQQLAELEQMGENVKESEARFRAIFHFSSEAIFIHDPETGAILDVNRTACELFGYSREEMLEGDVESLSAGTPPYTQKEAEAWMKKAAAGQPQRFEWHSRAASGRLFWTDVAITRAVIGNVERILVTARDVSERKAAEEKLKLSEHRLREAQRLAHLGYWELDIPANRLVWSDEVYRIFGLEPQSFAATYEAFLERVHPDDREAVDKAYRESLEKRTGYQIDHRLLLADGTIKYVSERCLTEYDDSGRPLRSMGTVLDITDRKLAEMEIQALNAELEQRVAERTAELVEKNRELERFNRLMVGRELRMVELKKEIERLGQEAESVQENREPRS